MDLEPLYSLAFCGLLVAALGELLQRPTDLSMEMTKSK